MARLCADDSEHRRNVHRLLDSVLRRPSVQHLDRVPPFDPRLRLRVGRDAGAVQQRNQPGHLRLLQRTPQARPGRGLLPAPSPTTGRPTALQAFGYSIMVYRGREVSIHPPPQKKKRSTFRLAPVPCLGPEAPAGSKGAAERASSAKEWGKYLRPYKDCRNLSNQGGKRNLAGAQARETRHMVAPVFVHTRQGRGTADM